MAHPCCGNRGVHSCAEFWLEYCICLKYFEDRPGSEREFYTVGHHFVYNDRYAYIIPWRQLTESHKNKRPDFSGKCRLTSQGDEKPKAQADCMLC